MNNKQQKKETMKKEKKEVLVYTGTGEVKTLEQERQINFNTLCRNIEDIDNQLFKNN